MNIHLENPLVSRLNLRRFQIEILMHLFLNLANVRGMHALKNAMILVDFMLCVCMYIALVIRMHSDRVDAGIMCSCRSTAQEISGR
jgi:hypothetical protein